MRDVTAGNDEDGGEEAAHLRYEVLRTGLLQLHSLVVCTRWSCSKKISLRIGYGRKNHNVYQWVWESLVHRQQPSYPWTFKTPFTRRELSKTTTWCEAVFLTTDIRRDCPVPHALQEQGLVFSGHQSKFLRIPIKTPLIGSRDRLIKTITVLWF